MASYPATTKATNDQYKYANYYQSTKLTNSTAINNKKESLLSKLNSIKDYSTNLTKLIDSLIKDANNNKFDDYINLLNDKNLDQLHYKNSSNINYY